MALTPEEEKELQELYDIANTKAPISLLTEHEMHRLEELRAKANKSKKKKK